MWLYCHVFSAFCHIANAISRTIYCNQTFDWKYGNYKRNCFILQIYYGYTFKIHMYHSTSFAWWIVRFCPDSFHFARFRTFHKNIYLWKMSVVYNIRIAFGLFYTLTEQLILSTYIYNCKINIIFQVVFF